MKKLVWFYLGIGLYIEVLGNLVGKVVNFLKFYFG